MRIPKGNDVSVIVVRAQDVANEWFSPEKVVLLGVLVEDPQTRLAGYAGSEPMIVWQGLVVPID